jgi:sugar phosphate isomerase/epimerase
MAEKSRYTIEGIYQGGYSSFKPSPNSGYFSVGSLGVTTDPRSANVLKEVSDKLSSGVKQIEIEAVTPDFFDQVAKQQLEETKRLAKLTGINISVHGPVIDTTGIDPRRGGYSESDRVLSEKKVIQTLERSHELNPDGNIPVNFHSAEGLPGSEFGPKPTKEGQRDYTRIIAVDRESGKLVPLEKEERFYPEGGQVVKKEYNPQKNLGILNETNWDNQVTQILFQKERFDDILEKNKPLLEPIIEEINKPNFNSSLLPPAQQDVLRKFQDANAYLEEMHKHANSLFSKAYEFGDDNQKAKLREIAKQLGDSMGDKVNPFKESEAMHDFLLALKDPRLGVAPKMYVPIEEFALSQSSKTYGNAAFESYKKYGDKAPILNIENPPAGFALSTGEDLKKLVEKSREQFIKRAVENEEKWSGIGEKAAERIAEKTIGATLDVGHMNMLRKYGYKEEDIIKESEKLAPVMKHLHLSDNFGFEHTELPMGMGNVPLKQIMEKLQKSGAKTEDMAKIIEASVWWTHFKTSPVYSSLELLGPRMSATGGGPAWSQVAGLSQDYYGGFGMMLPSTNYETFGAGFSRLPAELGGAMPGAGGSRMSGRQME